MYCTINSDYLRNDTDTDYNDWSGHGYLRGSSLILCPFQPHAKRLINSIRKGRKGLPSLLPPSLGLPKVDRGPRGTPFHPLNR